jgi:hypothetical protein
MRAPLLGVGLVGALLCAYLIHPVAPAALGPLLFIIFIGVFLVLAIARYLTREQHLRDWSSTLGRIESCNIRGVPEDGFQDYICIYLFTVDDARQAGELCFSARQNRLEEIKGALVGQQVTVRYDPNDCTNSIVEDKRINGWKVN